VDLSVFFAGTAGSVPSARRGLPAVLLRRGGDRILFDCGEGTQRQLVRSAGLADLSHVFLTHFHADHWLGLPGMLKSFELRDRDRPLTVMGPPGTAALLERMRFVFGRLRYPFAIHELEVDEEVWFGDWCISPFAVRHRGPAAFGYAIAEEPRPGRFDAELAARLGVEFGPDFGRLQRGETVNGVTPGQVIGEARPGRRIVLSGDTAPCDTLRAAAHRADLLVHEATFTSEEAERAFQTQHTTAEQAAEIARECEVGLLALTHLSSRYGGREIRDEARATFPDTVVPRDFDSIEVPFAERGKPELVHWEPRRHAPAAETAAEPPA
jgi:ribonuclease Z